MERNKQRKQELGWKGARGVRRGEVGIEALDGKWDRLNGCGRIGKGGSES